MTSAQVSIETSGPKLKLRSSANETFTYAQDFLVRNSCDPNTTGHRLVQLTQTLLFKAYATKPAEVTKLAGQTSPLLRVRDALLQLVPRCGSCSGTGCTQCDNKGFV